MASALPSGAPTVSVSMVTYNHERFIAQAIESVLMQKTAFFYELVIGEDCSSDATRTIVKDFQRRHPSQIRALFADRNLGAMPNYVRTLQACRGEYIAVLDGDDYWTDPQKLQAQVDFLTAHPESSLCYHNAAKVYEDGRAAPGLYCAAGQKPFSTLKDLLVQNSIPSCSVMVRNNFLKELPAWFGQMPFGDWPLYVLSAQHGNVAYLDRIMGAYRVHHLGIWSRESKIERLIHQVAVYKAFRAHLRPSYAGEIGAALSRCYLKLSSQYERRGDRQNARRYAAKALAAGGFGKGVDRKDLLARMLELYCPPLRKVARHAARLL
jgi:glycosyltransferase involved in cell wall biosynthesis